MENFINTNVQKLINLLSVKKGEESLLKNILSFVILGGLGVHFFRLNKINYGIAVVILTLIASAVNSTVMSIDPRGRDDILTLIAFVFNLPLFATYIHYILNCKKWVNEFNTVEAEETVETTVEEKA